MLDRVSIASPCPANWDSMPGTDQVRHCSQCNQNVYNLSAMTRRQAEKLLRETEGRLCARLYRRADGTILTENCPAGLRAIGRRVFFALVFIWFPPVYARTTLDVAFDTGRHSRYDH